MRLRIALLAVAVVLVGIHLALTYVVLGELDRRVIVLDAGIAIIGLAAAFWYVALLGEEREQRELGSVLFDILVEPRNIADTARRALAILVREDLARTATIALADDADAALYPLAAVGYPEGWVRQAEPLLPSELEAEPVLRHDRELHRWVEPVTERVGRRPWVAHIPLLSGIDPIGVLLIATPRPGPLRDPYLLERIGVQLSAALDNAAMYEAAYRREQALEEQDLRRREFMAAISHEVRTPLTSIQAFTELLHLGRPTMDETAEQLVTSLSQGVDQLNVLINDLIDLGRSGGSEYNVHTEEVDLIHVVQRAGEVMRPAFLLREQVLRYEVPDDSLHALTDVKLLERVILNILSNANRHAPVGGDVTLAAYDGGDGRVLIEVRDTGPGIDIEDRERIFQPYYRVEREGAQSVPGSGLGLAVARRIVDALGGDIWVEERDDPGACFCIAIRGVSRHASSATPAPSANETAEEDASEQVDDAVDDRAEEADVPTDEPPWRDELTEVDEVIADAPRLADPPPGDPGDDPPAR